MRAFADLLRRQGHQVTYLRLDDPANRQAIRDNVLQIIRSQGMTRFEYLLPDEYRLDIQLQELSVFLPVPCAADDTEHFLTQRRELKDTFAGKRRFLMESFYRRMRKRLDVLMEGGKPVGGGWNSETENRRPYDGSVPMPPPLFLENNVSEIVGMIRRYRIKTFGAIEPKQLIRPIDRLQALKLLTAFIADGLPLFGTYQGAMTLKSWSLFHSRLSFPLNAKILHPLEVIAAAVKAWEKDPQRIAIQKVEGFVRQILGWCEYMRGAYRALMPDFEEMTFLGTIFRCLASTGPQKPACAARPRSSVSP